MSERTRTLPVYPIAEVVPQTGPMRLIDRICACSDQAITVEVDITESSTFADAEGVPAWIGLEYMAQGIAALAGSRAKAQGRPVPVGFLVGTRALEAFTPRFALGSRLSIVAREQHLGSNGLGVYSCTIALAGEPDKLLLRGDINVFVPADFEQFSRGDAG